MVCREIGLEGPTGWKGTSEGDEVKETVVAVWRVSILMERVLSVILRQQN